MRPVLLTMEGFASFRDKAELDFRDVDYFALVGRTGAGKSTVIDAITFALYGTADRWGRDNAIRDALAPTANQAKVSLVFDASGRRYVIAREVRRTTQGVVQKSVSLEALVDPDGIGAASEEPGQVLAGDPRSARATVAALLGLDFDEFTKCVVLPQGKFSEFLISDPPRRRQILSRLLGEHRYGTMHQLADQRAAEAGGTITALAAQLDRLSNPTDDDIADLRQHHEQLVATSETVTRLVERLRETVREASALDEGVIQAGRQLETLNVDVPADVDTLDKDRASAAAALAAAESVAISSAARAAEARRLQQEHLSVDLARQLLADHHQLSILTGQLPTLIADHRRAAEQESKQQLRSKAADQAQEKARTARDEKAVAHQRVSAIVEVLKSSIALLAATRPPAGVGKLAAAVAAAELCETTAREQLEAVESEVRELRAQQIDPDTLAHARQTLARAEEAKVRSTQLIALLEGDAPLRASLEQATVARDTAQEELAELEDRRRHLTLSATAADLRTQLRPGDACPVCDQVVTEVHTAATAEDPERRNLADQVPVQVKRLRQAEVRLREAAAALQQHQARAELLQEQVDADQLALDDVDQSALQATVERARQQSDLLATLEADAATARSRTHDAAVARKSLAAEEAAARRQLVAELQRLARLDPPALGVDDLTQAWNDLHAWATVRHAELAEEEQAARHAAESANEELAAAEAAYANAAAEAEAARGDVMLSVRASTEAEQQLRRCESDRADLSARLAGRPNAAQAQQLLECALELATGVERAHGRDDEARRQLEQARAASEAAGRRMADARERLARRRDPLVALGAPPPAGTSLRQDWDELCTWAKAAANKLRKDSDADAARLAELKGTTEEETTQLATLLAEASIDVPAEPPTAQMAASAETWVALATAEASRSVQQAVTDRDERVRLTVNLAEAQERQAVAAQLSRLLNPAQFEKWLTNTVMTRLVADASTTLYQLSGQQFTLSHDARSEFVVVDHADGNSARSVKTLSGGETFQASLALALALSSHMAALGAGGTSKLGSIFLDEGFGTLDPDALTVVADTLATLAQGDRLVGVVTHVAELADTIPNRFIVERDSRTSTLRKDS